MLTTLQRESLRSGISEDVSTRREAFAVSKADLLAAIDAVDDWVDANATSYNSAIPLPARTQLTAKQKAQLLMYVVRLRFEVT